MRINVGIDIAKEMHWVTAVDSDGVVLIDRKLANTPTEIAGLVQELARLGGAVRVGLDVIGGIAGLAEAMLAERGFALVHVPGLAVHRARQGTVGGENKSDPRDARAIADQVSTRGDLRAIATWSTDRPSAWRACTTCWSASSRVWSAPSISPPRGRSIFRRGS